ncbi:MAG: hypothetical protein U5K56_05595 [Halioglobus sp.]|nr:hypothetical protein [Halioglobus sp.]
MANIDFTLRVFPNHPRALNGAVRFSLQRDGTRPMKEACRRSVYLQRAIGFVPNDPMPYKLLGYLPATEGGRNRHASLPAQQ